MNLVTVTCERDFLSLILQAKSVQKYVKECIHWVIINDTDPYSIDWQLLLSPYYDNKRHVLKLIYHDPKYWKLIYNGWVIQQILKLEAINFVQDNYLLLDSKNFFVVPTDLTTWKDDGCGILVSEKINSEVYNLWLPVSQIYADDLGMSLLDTYYAPETPFFIKKDIATAAINRLEFGKWFIENSYSAPGASEFLYYSYFLIKNGYQINWHRRHHCIWPVPAHLNYIDKWFNASDFNLMEISGIHRVWIEKANLESRKKVYDWLDNLGLLEEQTKNLFLLGDE